MKTGINKIWSCKLNRPSTLKSHRTLATASKHVGDTGVVYDPVTDTVFQVVEMADGSFTRRSTETQKARNNLCGFDLRNLLNGIDSAEAKKAIINEKRLEIEMVEKPELEKRGSDIEEASIFLRQEISKAELEGKIPEADAIVFTKQLRNIELALKRNHPNSMKNPNITKDKARELVISFLDANRDDGHGIPFSRFPEEEREEQIREGVQKYMDDGYLTIRDKYKIRGGVNTLNELGDWVDR